MTSHRFTVLQLEHLVVASFAEANGARAASSLLRRLITALGPAGAYSVAINRQRGSAVHCAFERQADADLLARAVNARTTARDGGWKSQREFMLDTRSWSRILKKLDDLARPVPASTPGANGLSAPGADQFRRDGTG